MAVHVQLYRGTTAQNDAYTGLDGEVTVDTTTGAIRVHDGKTQGGSIVGNKIVYAESEPAEADVAAGTVVFYPATNLLGD